MRKLVIFGNGEIASMARFYFDNDSDYKVVGFSVDDQYAEDYQFEGLPLAAYSEVSKMIDADTFIFCALSYQRLNKLRAEKFEQLRSGGFKFASYVSSRAFVADTVKIGKNCLILENQTVQDRVQLGDNVFLWSANHIGHGAAIGSHSYLASHVCISGHVKIGERCFFGVNSSVADFVEIGSDVIVGMGASVGSNMPDFSTVVATKSNYLPPDSRQNLALRRRYFGKLSKTI